MPKSEFSQKLLKILDKLDRSDLESYVKQLSQEIDFKEGILDSLQEGILLTDSKGTITFVNDPFLRIFQTTKQKIKESHIEDFFSQLKLDPKDLIKNLFVDQQTCSLDFLFEVSLPTWCRMVAVPLVNEKKELAGTCITFKDITDLKQLNQKQIFTEKWNTLVPLAAGLAHEIGNPLNALDIHMQLAQREIADLPLSKKNKVEKYLKVAKEEINRLDRIVSHFLMAIRPLKGNYQLEDVNKLLDEALDFMVPEASLAKVTVERRFQTQLPSTLVDRDQLKQAFFNIIKNAIQAMPQGGLLKVETELKNQQIRVLFSDTGKGIEPEEFSHIFEPYYSSKEKGSGLGLVAVRRILSEHGGNIQVHSTPRKGTQFVILLPLASVAQKPLLPESKSPTKALKRKKAKR